MTNFNQTSIAVLLSKAIYSKDMVTYNRNKSDENLMLDTSCIIYEKCNTYICRAIHYKSKDADTLQVIVDTQKDPVFHEYLITCTVLLDVYKNDRDIDLISHLTNMIMFAIDSCERKMSK